VGRATRTEGGFRFRRSLELLLRIRSRTWCLLGGLVMEDGKPVDSSGPSWCRGPDYVIEDVWDTVGLRGTGSKRHPG
jgi:3-hydroxy-9,10-secoandrosta-1,3,5(10)-triene-9,17-dione monooxygenase